MSLVKSFCFMLLMTFLFSCSEEKRVNRNVGFIFEPSYKVTLQGKVEDAKPATGLCHISFVAEQKFNLRWKKISDNCPKEWHIYFCDNVSCYFEMPDSSDLNPIDKNTKEEDRRMKLYVESNQKSGEGIVKIALFNPKNRLQADTIEYLISIH